MKRANQPFWMPVIGLALVAAAPAWPVLTSVRLGSVKIGMTPEQAEKALGYKIRIDYPNDQSCGQGADRRMAGVSYLFEAGKLARIDVTGGTVSAYRVAIGNSEKSALAALRRSGPGKVSVEPHKYVDGGHYLTIRAKDGTGAVFETENGRVTRFRAGRFPAVQYVEGCL